MKDQYFGDVNDYRKYGLLRKFADAGLGLGVCWMLTPPDGRADGKHTSYRRQPSRWRHFDPELYDALVQSADKAARRCVANAEAWNILPNALYFSQPLSDSREPRSAFFSAARVALSAADLLFFDPDNGIASQSRVLGRKHSSKYLWWSEVASAFTTGRSVLIYQHWQRKPRESQIEASVTCLRQHTRAPLICTFRTSFVLFLLAAQQRHVAASEQALAAVATCWQGQLEPSKWRCSDLALRARPEPPAVRHRRNS